MIRQTLPLTTFEKFMLWGDRPAYPYSCFARFHFSGRIDRAALDSALRTIMPRHPLFGSRLEMRRWRLVWSVQPDVLPEIEWITGPTGGAFPAARHQDLTKEIGLRLLIVEDSDLCDITFQWHHACSDGAGFEAFFNDFLIAYALAKGEQTDRVRLPERSVERLKRRGAYGLTFWKLLKMLPMQAAGLAGARQYYSRAPSPVLPHHAVPDDDPVPSGYPATRTHTTTREELVVLKERTRERRVSLNDLVARDVFLALREWRSRHDSGADDAWIRMMVPVNLRSVRDYLLPAANIVGFVFLDRRDVDFSDPDQLLAGIVNELRFIKERGLGLTSILGLNLLNLIPGKLKHSGRKDSRQVSIVLSSLGRPLLRSPLPRDQKRIVAGNLLFESAETAVPISPFNSVTLIALEYAQRLSTTMHYDPRVLTAAQADDLIATFGRYLQASMSEKR